MNVETRTALGSIELRDDGRTLVGLVMPWDTPARIAGYTEVFHHGAFGDVDPAKVPLTVAHHHDELPIGRAVAFTDTGTGLQAELRISETRHGDDVLALVKDGAATGLSVGFIPLTDRWTPDRMSVVRVRAELVEVSIVGFPAYTDARIAAVRAAHHDDTTPRLHLQLRRGF